MARSTALIVLLLCQCFVNLVHFAQFQTYLIVKFRPLVTVEFLHHPVACNILPEEYNHHGLCSFPLQRVQLQPFGEIVLNNADEAFARWCLGKWSL